MSLALRNPRAADLWAWLKERADAWMLEGGPEEWGRRRRSPGDPGNAATPPFWDPFVEKALSRAGIVYASRIPTSPS